MPIPVLFQWRIAPGDTWFTAECVGIPVVIPAKVRIDFTPAAQLPDSSGLMEELKRLVTRVQGTWKDGAAGALVEPADGENLLEVLVSDGVTAVTLEPRIASALKAPRHTWVLPMMPSTGSPGVLPPEAQTRNIAFWAASVNELALTVLARAGVTSLDRRVFISYRRVETEPMAGQLFEELTKRNFGVFLDTVSVDPGVNFQASLFEQLADKSMVVLLHSETFSRSRWTMEEVTYAKEHELSVLILRLPNVPSGDPLEQLYRGGDVVRLEDTDLENARVGPPARLTSTALDRIVHRILLQHDVEMINRLATLRRRTLAALGEHQVGFHESSSGASIFAEADGGGKTYRLFPTSRPPGLPDLFEASNFMHEPGDLRIVIGHVSSFNADRVRHLDWTVDGRNVAYADVSMLDTLVQEIKLGRL